MGREAVLSLFKNVIDSFTYIQLGQNFGDEKFRTSLIKLDVARLRLSQWGEVVGLGGSLGEQEDTKTILSEDDISSAERILGEILHLFRVCRDASRKFLAEENPKDKSLQVYEETDLDSMTRRLLRDLKRLSTIRQRGAGLERKAKWTLFAEKDFEELILRITNLTRDLELLVTREAKHLERLSQHQIDEIFTTVRLSISGARGEDYERLFSHLSVVFQGLKQLRLSQHQIDEVFTTVRNSIFAAKDGDYERLFPHLSVVLQGLKQLNPPPQKSQAEFGFQITKPTLQTRDAEFDFQTTSPKIRLSTCDDMSKLQGWITNILAQASPTTIQDRKYNTCFKVVDPCAFLEFMREGYPRDTDLKRVLTLTGTSENAIAESAGYYVNKIWPKYGLPVLDWIWQFFDIRNLCEDLDLGQELSLRAIRPKCRGSDGNHDWWSIQAQGSLTAIAAFALQLAWIFAAFRRPSKALALSIPEMTMQHSASGISAEEQIIFELNRQSLKDAPTTQTTATCWNPIFHSIVIAYGFPIPERPHEMRGLELPLPLMVSLSNLEYNLQYLDGFVLKGRSAAALPEYTRLHGGKRCIQWHIIRNHDNSELDMKSFHKEAMRLKLPLISSKTEAFSELAGSAEKYLDTIPTLEGSFGGSVSENRHFLGLYRDARIHLGTADSKPQNIKTVLRDEGVGDPSTRIKWTRTLGISASLGPPHINFGTSTSFELSKWSITSSDLGPIETQVGKACENLSVLYDTQRKVGWMVPEIYLIFHLMRRHMQDKRTFTPSTIHPAFMDMKAEDLPTRSVEYVKSSPTVRELFESFDSRFRQMKEMIIGNKKGVPLFSFHTGSTQRILCGVDFVHLSDLPDSWSIKHVDVGRMGSGGWTEVVKDQGKEECKQREMILVFFCKTLDPEPIRPNPLNNTCGTWQSIPGDKNYLVTTYSCISSLSQRYGGDLTDPKLTSNHYWVGSQNDPFQCATPDCNRLQKIANNPVQINWEEPQLDAALVFGGTFVNSGQCQPLPAAPPAEAIAIVEMAVPVELP